MAYTEIKSRNNKKYFYRVVSVRDGKKVRKSRIYLGADLSRDILSEKEKSADSRFNSTRINKGLSQIKDKIIGVLRKNHVKKAGIFGSYARGEQKKNSDIDILIEPPKGMGFGFVKIVYDLENALNKKVDLVTYNGIHHLLRKKILKEEKQILYG